MKLFKFILIGTVALITPTITFAVTPLNSSQLAPSPIDGYVLKTLSGINVWSPGGGGSGGGTWSTTTSQVSGRLINYPNNNTDVIAIGANSTTSSAFWFDPNTTTGYVSGKLGIGTTSPGQRLSVSGDILGNNIIGSYFNATSSIASVFPYASTTAISAGNAWFTGNLGIGTSSPLARLTLHANNGDTNRLLLAIGSSTQSATTTLLALNNIGYLGLGSSTPSAVLDITPASAFIPSLAVNGGQGGIDIARFYRDASSGMGLAFLSPGSIPQISFRINMSSLSAGTSRNSLLVDSAGATFRIATSTTNAVNDLEPFVIKNSNGFVGIATSSPFAQFSIQPNIYNGSAPSFVIGSSTGTSVIVNGSGFVGIGTSTPKGQLSVSSGSSLYTSVAPLFVENNGAAGGSYVAQFSSGSSVGNSYPSFNLTNSGTTILNSQSQFMYYGTINAPGSGGGNQKGQLYITNGNSSTNWFNIFVDSSTNANLSANGPIRVFKTLGGTSDIFNVASSTGGLATSTYLTVNAYGNVGIGTSSPTTKLSVSGSIYSVENVPATTTSISVNLATTSNQILVQLGTSATTITLDNILAGMGTRIVTCNPNASAGAVTFTTNPAGLLLWTGGTVPTQTTTANKCDIWTFTATQATSTSARNVKIFGAQVPNF